MAAFERENRLFQSHVFGMLLDVNHKHAQHYTKNSDLDMQYNNFELKSQRQGFEKLSSNRF